MRSSDFAVNWQVLWSVAPCPLRNCCAYIRTLSCEVTPTIAGAPPAVAGTVPPLLIEVAGWNERSAGPRPPGANGAGVRKNGIIPGMASTVDYDNPEVIYCTCGA